MKRYSKPAEQRLQEDDQRAGLCRLRAELKRVTEERDILKRPQRTLRGSATEVRLHQSAIRRLFGSPLMPDLESTCQWLLHLAELKSARAKDDQRLLGLIKRSWLESGGVYGYRKIHDDLRELGERAAGIVLLD